MTPPRVIVTIDELVVDGRALDSGDDVAEAVRAELESVPALRASLDAARVAAAVASAVDASMESS
jgi:hypothetical protein